ncbi:MAG TPA: TonB-dependent receptor [Albitalea sp.]|uniref:TonB-dependent receptor n=1 Tax=Piscinibacter sp. TaxID=1903157 RepID=UPI002ED04914
MHRSHKEPPLARTLVALVAASFAPLHHALAQSAPAGGESARLAPVMVTAERRVEDIKDVPSAISTLGGEGLDVINSGGQDIRMLSGRVPSLNIESSFGRAFPRFYVRGLGNTDFDLNASQPVSLVFDDVVQENPILKGFPVFDLERIEVLRGPQGTLFGRNAPAGVVKFESARPSQKPGGYFSATAGSENSLNLEGAWNLPLSGVLAARVSLQTQHRGDWVTNTNGGPTSSLEGFDDNAARVQLLWQPRKEFSALLNVHGRHLEGSARLFRANIIQPGTNDLVAGFDEKKIAIDGINSQKLTGSGASLRLRWQLDGLTLHSITGFEHVSSFSRGDIDGSAGPYTFNFATAVPGTVPFPSESADGLPRHQQLTQELRLESNDKGPLNWLAGVYVFDERITVDSFDYATLNGNAQDGYAVQHQKNRAGALFGSVNYAVSERLKLRGGLRYTDDRKDYDAQRFVSPIGGGATGLITTNPRAKDTSWDLSGTYAVSPDANVYARVATGFRAPSIQGRLLFGDEVTVAGKEKVLSYEAGVKADLFDKRARVAFSVFQYTVKNQQLTAVGGDANFNRLINAEKTVGRGAELDLQAYLSDNLLVGLGASLNDTKIHDPNLSVQPCGLSGCTVLDPPNAARPGTVFIDGNPLPQAPKTVLTLTARYGIPTASGGEWFVYTDWSYRSKINFFLYESVEYTGKSLLEGGLRLGYLWGGGKYEAAVFARNITNQIRTVGGIDFNNLTGFINEPRFVGAQFKAMF